MVGSGESKWKIVNIPTFRTSLWSNEIWKLPEWNMHAYTLGPLQKVFFFFFGPLQPSTTDMSYAQSLWLPCPFCRLSLLSCTCIFTLFLTLRYHILLDNDIAYLHLLDFRTRSISYSCFGHHHSRWHTVGTSSIFVEMKERIYFTNKQKCRQHTNPGK